MSPQDRPPATGAEARLYDAGKARLLLAALLATATVVCAAMIRLRILLTGSGHYAFLVWNLLLAWIPFWLAYCAYHTARRRRPAITILAASAFLWLLFIPNAPYLLTDFQHLSAGNGGIPVWYDVLLLAWFSLTGLFLGMSSLFLMHEVVRGSFGRWAGWSFAGGVAFLSAVGVYAGRFLRWNSWDVLRHPVDLLLFTVKHAADPSLRAVTFTALFSALFLFVYLALYAFARLLTGHQSLQAPDQR